MRWGRALAAAAAALLLGGCGGPVEQGLEVGSGEGSDQLRYIPPGPFDGATREQIVHDFIRAGAASGGEYDNARKFLTQQVAGTWDPDRTLVLLADDDTTSATLEDPAHVRVTGKLAATVDPTGRYTPAAPGSTVSATFALSSVSGQWRISELPEGFGRWISRGDVSRLVQPYAVHYVSASRRATVPDVRWFPVDKLYTRLARAQLTGVPDFLVGAATSAVPQGARLLGDAVSLESGTAAVNLISSKLATGETTRQNVWAQFVSTLTEDPSVAQVTVAVDGTPVDVAGLNGPASGLSDIGFPEPAGVTQVLPVVRRGSEVTVFDPTGVAQRGPLQAPGQGTYPPIDPAYTHLALSADGIEIAGVDPGGDGISRWRGANRYQVPGVGTDVGNPSYDRRGYLWVGGVGADGQRLWVVDRAGDPANPQTSRPTAVRADWLAGRRVVESRVAADGDRIAVLSTKVGGGDPRIDLAGVVRDANGRPERLASTPLRLGVTVTSAAGLTWVDDTSLATLATVGKGALTPTILGVGGEVRQLTEAPDAASITTTGGERDLYVITTKGRLLARVGPQWSDAGPGTDLAVAAG
jgi:hypothetical protein